jgi:integrase
MRVTSLREFYATFFEPLRLRSRSQRTKDLYQTSLRNLAKFLERQPRLSDLSDDTINRYLAWFRALGRAPSSVNKERANVLAIWRFACRKHYVKDWPDVEMEIEPRRLPMAWLEHEVRALFAACTQEPGSICGVPAGLWWSCLLMVIWDSGERISAVAGLRWPAIDLRSGWVVVSAELRKGKRADRGYRLAPDTVAMLKSLRKHCRDDRVFPWPYTPNYLWLKFNVVLARAGLPTDRRSKFHRVRRSVASYFEAAGGDATQLLDHSDRRVTIRSYLDVRICGQKQAADVLFRPTG